MNVSKKAPKSDIGEDHHTPSRPQKRGRIKTRGIKMITCRDKHHTPATISVAYYFYNRHNAFLFPKE
jgi:hypothetical protein